jgi:hypothetical protein
MLNTGRIYDQLGPSSRNAWNPGHLAVVLLLPGGVNVGLIERLGLKVYKHDDTVVVGSKHDTFNEFWFLYDLECPTFIRNEVKNGKA